MVRLQPVQSFLVHSVVSVVFALDGYLLQFAYLMATQYTRLLDSRSPTFGVFKNSVTILATLIALVSLLEVFER